MYSCLRQREQTCSHLFTPDDQFIFYNSCFFWVLESWWKSLVCSHRKTTCFLFSQYTPSFLTWYQGHQPFSYVAWPFSSPPKCSPPLHLSFITVGFLISKLIYNHTLCAWAPPFLFPHERSPFGIYSLQLSSVNCSFWILFGFLACPVLVVQLVLRTPPLRTLPTGSLSTSLKEQNR